MALGDTLRESIDKKIAEARPIVKEVVRHFEGDHLESYVLPGESWATISVGCAIPMSQHPKKITQAESDRMFDNMLSLKLNKLLQEIPAAVIEKLTVGQLVCAWSFRYNVKDSTWNHPSCNTRKSLVRGDIKEFLRWHAKWIHGEGGKLLKGLQRRRGVEQDLARGKELAKIKQAHWYIHLYVCLALFFLLSVPMGHAQNNIDSKPIKKPGLIERCYDRCHKWAGDHPKVWGGTKFTAKAGLWFIQTAGAVAQATQKKTL